MKAWFSAKELAGLPGLPATVQGVNMRAKADGWNSRDAQTKGGGRQYAFASLPGEAQATLVAQAVGADAPDPRQAELMLVPVEQLTDRQRQVMSARLAIVREIERMGRVLSQRRAIETLIQMADEQRLPPYLAERLPVANDRSNQERTVSERTIKGWISAFRQFGEEGLAPKKRTKDLSVPVWAADFLRFYQKPQKPTVRAAYEKFARTFASRPHCPTINQVRRFLATLSPEAREQGRRSAQDLKALQAMRRMDTGHLWPNDVWMADGHCFDAEVLNPLTGQPFRPEITMVIDWATRRIVGFAVNLAESTVATIDALRDAVSRVGMFGLFYVDNGSGFANSTVYEVIDRLGGTVVHSLPYNSQSRGAIERPHKTILVTLAREFDSYIGATMDKQAATRIHRISRKALKSGLKPAQIPDFQTFYERLVEAVEEYNYRPHSSQRKVRDMDSGRLRHQSPMEAWASAEAEGWEALAAAPTVIADLLRPQLIRKTSRGEVRLGGGIYFLAELVDLHGDEVRVAFDYRDASRVWVYTLDGVQIGEALLGGNQVRAMQSRLEKAAARREQGQLARLTQKARVLTGQDVEIRPLPRSADGITDAQIQDAQDMLVRLEQARTRPETLAIPTDPTERYHLWNRLKEHLDNGEELTPAEKHWLEVYDKHDDMRALRKVFGSAGLAARNTANAR